jgi:hypothetical protein
MINGFEHSSKLSLIYRRIAENSLAVIYAHVIGRQLKGSLSNAAHDNFAEKAPINSSPAPTIDNRQQRQSR